MNWSDPLGTTGLRNRDAEVRPCTPRTRLPECIEKCAKKKQIVKVCVEARVGKQRWTMTVCSCADVPGWDQIQKRIARGSGVLKIATNTLCALWYMDCFNSVWNRRYDDIDAAICNCHEALDEANSNANYIQQCALDIACGELRGILGMFCSNFAKRDRGK